MSKLPLIAVFFSLALAGTPVLAQDSMMPQGTMDKQEMKKKKDAMSKESMSKEKQEKKDKQPMAAERMSH